MKFAVINYNSRWHLTSPVMYSYTEACNYIKANYQGNSLRIIHESFMDSLEAFEAPSKEQDEAYYNRFSHVS